MKYPEIAKRIRYIMELRKIKAVDLCAKLEISAATVSHYYNGKRCPSTEIALEMGRLFNCNPLWLMDLSDDMDYEAFKRTTSEHKSDKNQYILDELSTLPEETQERLGQYFLAMIKAEKNRGETNE